jgi:hypothetical protein
LDNKNEDFIYGRNTPVPHLGIMGIQWADSLADTNGKRPTDGAPMYIAVNSPGATASTDEEWLSTYGGSLDAFLSIINGGKLSDSILDVQVAGIYRTGSSNALTINLWNPVQVAGESTQQIQYLVSKSTVDEGTTATASYGSMDDARGIGLRLPAMAGGYGRQIDGRPTDPNSTTADGRANDDEHKLARETWKFGPIDMPWDYNRQVWAGYNYITVDHEDQSLGTWIFSTNSDNTAGYPFMRGRMEDAWWVRQTFELRTTDGRNENVQTAEVMTHLNHKLFDEDENGAARLSSVFIVPHDNGASPAGSDSCHDRGDEWEVGGEKTGNSEFIDIRTTAHFWKELAVCGPIKFGGKVSELDVCCNNGDAKYFVGEMIFKDVPVDDCEGHGGDDATCEWVPAIQIDECELVGEHFVKLVTNDAALGVRMSQMCNDIATWTTNLQTNINATNGAIGATLGCLNTEIQDLALNVSNALAMVSVNDTDFTVDVGNKIEDILEDMVDQINAAFDAIKACTLCEVETDIELDLSNLPWNRHAEIAPLVTADPCILGSISGPPNFPCDNCTGTHLLGPCVEPATFLAGNACGGGAVPTITTEYGECGVH